jgi:bifunctional ADP-heptose synthase (sugar kinase/adenylyltransferase)
MLKEKISEFIDKVKDFSVLIVGETIIDEFVTVNYEGQSMKSICPVYSLEGEKSIQQGGASAIYNHLKGFVKNIEIITNTNNEIVKTRYVDKEDKKKHVEINRFNVSSFGFIDIDTSKFDVVIVADFGHGFCDKLTIKDGFHLMCQTNSNNFGFNRVSKWKKYKKNSICLDLREASLQMNTRNKFVSNDEVLELYNYEMRTSNLFLTLGREGVIYSDGVNVFRQKSFESEVVDTIGAGDTFFAFSCLSSSIETKNKSEIMIVPALAASLSTTWLCNERSVTPQNLISYADRYL